MPKPNTLLRKEREARGWSQEKVAEMIGADPDSIRNWETGRRGTSRYYQLKLVHIFGLPPERLGFPVDRTDTSSLPEEAVPLPAEIPPPTQGGAPSAHMVLPPSQAENPTQFEHLLLDQVGDENRHRLLWQIRRTWIDGVLKHFLDPGMFILLNMSEMPEALENPWHALVRETNGVARELPNGTSIVQMYDIANEELLILGDAGAGKTTLLLALARELLIRAEQNEKYPIPVIFNLTSWAGKPESLAEWMAEEMHIKYHVPKEVAQTWIEDDQVIALLDSLDEIRPEALPSYFKAIRAYQDARARCSLVICCRNGDYFAQDVRLSLQKAVQIQPLTSVQIRDYVTTADGQLDAVRQALQDDPELEHLCSSPLMLNIAARAYQGQGAAILISGESLEARRKHIFEAYVDRMLSRRGMEFHYDQQQTLHWLAWLAEQMQKRNQTEWYLERSQPSWLPDEQTQHRFRHAAIRVIYGIKCFLVAGLFALLPGGVFTTFLETGQRAVLRAGSSNEALGWIAPGIAGGSASLGIILALVTILVFLMVGPQVPTISLQAVKRGFIEAMRTGVITGGIIGFCAALVCIPATGIEGGLVRGADIGLLGGLLIGIQWGLLAALRKKSPLDSNEQERHLRSFSFSLFRSRRLLDRLLDFLVFSSCAGVGYGGIYALLIKGITPDVIRYSTITALFFGIVLSWGNITEWVQGIGDAIQPAETATWSWTAVRRTLRSTLKRGGIIGLIVTICVIILLGTASGLFYGVNYGIRFGFVCGPIIGLTGATAALLTGVLNSGWKTAMLPDHQIVQPNEGIRRSLKNAVFAGCLFGPLGGLASGLISGLAFGYIGGFSRWPVQSIICALVFSMIFAFQFALVYGGIAWLQHYLLRWYLWKSGNLPANWRRFFDYASERILLIKVGGGYMFAHKLLLDYFASLRAVETDQRGETNPPGSSPRSIGQSTSDTR